MRPDTLVRLVQILEEHQRLVRLQVRLILVELLATLQLIKGQQVRKVVKIVHQLKHIPDLLLIQEVQVHPEVILRQQEVIITAAGVILLQVEAIAVAQEVILHPVAAVVVVPKAVEALAEAVEVQAEVAVDLVKVVEEEDKIY